MNRLPESVTQKFNELFAVIGKAGDDLKLATAEAAMAGNFDQVSVASDHCLRLQSLEMEIKNCLSHFESQYQQKSVESCVHKKARRRPRKSRGRFRVTIADKLIEETTIAETFVKTLRAFNLERVAKLNKTLSAVPLIAKTPANGYQTQKRCDGWYITTHVNKHNATALIEEIGKDLNIPVKVEFIER
ncbi:hypothetical protein [Methylotuvimicrobium buryatense]|uniref:Uncharacterized protein n=1 Tax=Methylotuvimicrobium buryatense TaxID=95641 RepID=A0A4P9UQV0_METBY|nr:hypothetical protein [Methylotuvimicrobium buryatense]QCW83832.1 hypothetical protein EQU24_17470 [Methylotuvimicrobium buryatense]